MFGYLDKIESIASQKFGGEEPLHINGLRNRLFKMVDELNVFASDKALINSDLREIKLKLSPQDINYFESALDLSLQNGGHVLPPEALDKRKITIRYDGEKYDATLKLHGDAYNHYAFYKKSFKVVFDEVDPPERYRDWRLLIPDDRGYFSPFISNYVNELVGLPTIENNFAKVYINDIFYGLYYTEEKYDEKYLEKNRLSNHVILRFDNVAEKNMGSVNMFDTYRIDHFDDLVLDTFSTSTREGIIATINDFFNAINEYDVTRLKRYIDMEQMGKFEAWRVILGKNHDVSLGNMRLAYNLSSGKFFILPRLESDINQVDKTYVIEDNLYRFIREDERITAYRDVALHTLIDHKNDILDYYQTLTQAYLPLILSDNTISRGKRQRKKTIEDDSIELEHNIEYWRTYISDNNTALGGYEDIGVHKAYLSVDPFTFYRDGSRMILPAGTYHVTEDTILPLGYHFVFSAGVTVSIDKDVSVVSYSPIDMDGSAQHTIIIRSFSEDPFGVFAVQGVDMSTCSMSVDYVDVSNGNEAFVDGVFYSGGFDVYYCDVVMNNSRIHNNVADDGLNVKHAHVELVNNQFINNFADQVDLDYCEGRVAENYFADQIDGDTNGDGLDMSGSRIVAVENIFQHFVDKGLSIGEESLVYLLNNTISQNTNGMAVKDLSRVYVDNNMFSDNIVDINIYQKKDIFGGGEVFVPANTWVLENDGLSSVSTFSTDDFSLVYDEYFYDL